MVRALKGTGTDIDHVSKVKQFRSVEILFMCDTFILMHSIATLHVRAFTLYLLYLGVRTPFKLRKSSTRFRHLVVASWVKLKSSELLLEVKWMEEFWFRVPVEILFPIKSKEVEKIAGRIHQQAGVELQISVESSKLRYHLYAVEGYLKVFSFYQKER